MPLCTKCKTRRPISDFHVDNTKKSGHRADCKFCRNERLLGDHKNRDPFSLMCSDAKKRAKLKGRDFALTPDDLRTMYKAQDGKCAQTLMPLADKFSKSPWRMTVDRIDNAKGYTKDNIQIVTVTYNNAKNIYKSNVVLEMSIALCRAKNLLT